MKQNKIIIFDFDGTLADTQLMAMRCYNQLADAFGSKKVDLNSIETIRAMTGKEILKHLNLSLFRLPFLGKKMHPLVKEGLKQVDPFNGVKEMLDSLTDKGIICGIVSSNNDIIIQETLDRWGWSMMQFVQGGARAFGKHKYIQRLAKKLNVSLDDIVYIGDEDRDIQCAKKAGVQAVAVSWGFQQRQVLAKFSPDAIADTPADLLEIICG